MVRSSHTCSSADLALLRWTAGLGAVTANATASHLQLKTATAQARLRACERAGLLVAARVLAGAPTLYTVTPAGLRACGADELSPCRITATNAAHSIACVTAAAALELAYPDHVVMGERELRRQERASRRALASAELGRWRGDCPQLHRPDLALWPGGDGPRRPVAVEVELTVKAPRRLLDICRAWARCRCVEGTIYLAAPEAHRALQRALAQARADGRIVLLALDALPVARAGEPVRTVPTGA
jgi:hypothetical protein